MKDFASSGHQCRPLTDRDGIEYDSSDDELEQLPDIITDAMNDLSIDTAPLARWHGKSSSKFVCFGPPCYAL